MADCYAAECPHGKQCVSIAPNYYLYDCPNPPTPPSGPQLQPSGDYASSSGGDIEILTFQPGSLPTSSSGGGGNPIIDFFVNLFNDVKDTVSSWFGSNATGTEIYNEAVVQPRGIMENRALVDELLFPNTSTVTPTAPSTVTTTTTTPTTTAPVNKRGGEQKSTPPKTYNIFGHEISIPQAMVIPIIIAVAILAIVLFRWLL